MPDKVDRRIQRTRQSLQDALITLILEKGYEAVTVQDVIDRANVGRATFYAHFQDKEDLLLSEFEQLSAQFNQHIETQGLNGTDLWSLSRFMFIHAGDYYRIYKAAVGKQSGQIMQVHLRKYLTKLIEECFQPQWSRQQNNIIPLEIVIHHLVSSLLSLLTWWLDHNMPHSPERMAEIYQQLTQPGMDVILGQK